MTEEKIDRRTSGVSDRRVNPERRSLSRVISEVSPRRKIKDRRKKSLW